MPDPIITNGVRALTVIEHESGLPEDRFVNSWAFQYDGTQTDYETVAPLIALALEDFFCTDTTTAQAVMDWMPGNALGAMTVRTYDLAQTAPREPTIFDATSFAPPSSSPLPLEVAVCSSFYSLRNLPRQRGRVYLGPWDTSAVANTAEAYPQPAVSLRQTIVQASNRLADHALNDPGFWKWGVLSPTDQDIKPITNGWVDNAFDTQRRRGNTATMRETWEAQ